jgi:hypothetical protein
MYEKKHSVSIFVLPSVGNVQYEQLLKTVPASLERDKSHKSIADSADSEISHVIVLSEF